MKYLSSIRLLALFLLAFLAGVAQAGYWKVELLPVGKNVDTSLLETDWPALEPQYGWGYPSNQTAQFNRQATFKRTAVGTDDVTNGAMYGAITARLTWVPANPNDLPPGSIDVREIMSAQAEYSSTASFLNTLSGTANCFADNYPLIIDGWTIDFQGGRYKVRINPGFVTTTIPIEGRTEIYLPTRRLGCSASSRGYRPIGPSSSGSSGSIGYTVQVMTYSNAPPGAVPNFRVTDGKVDSVAIKTSSLPNATVGQTYSAKLEAEGKCAITLKWDTAPRATGYVVDRVPTAPGFPINVAGTQLIDQNEVKANTEYYYRIVAVNAAGSGPKSSPLSKSVEFNDSDLKWLAEGLSLDSDRNHLPKGLVWEGDSTLGGKPGHQGTYNLKIWTKLTSDVIGTKELNLTVLPAPTLTISTSSLPRAVVEQDYNAQLLATGGYGKLSWTLKPGGWSEWFKVSHDGYLGGVPSIEDYLNSAQIEVEVRDESGQVATKSFANPVYVSNLSEPEGGTEFQDDLSYQLHRVFSIPPDPELAIEDVEAPFEGGDANFLEGDKWASVNLFGVELPLSYVGPAYCKRIVGEAALNSMLDNLIRGGGGWTPGAHSTGFRCTWFGSGKAHGIDFNKNAWRNLVELRSVVNLEAGRLVFYSSSNSQFISDLLVKYPNAMNLEDIYTSCVQIYSSNFKVSFDQRWILTESSAIGSSKYNNKYNWARKRFLERKMYEWVDDLVKTNGKVGQVEMFKSRFSIGGDGTHYAVPKAGQMKVFGKLEGFLRQIRYQNYGRQLEGAERMQVVKAIKGANSAVNEADVVVVKSGGRARTFLGGAGHALGYILVPLGTAANLYLAEDPTKAFVKEIGFVSGAFAASTWAAIYFSPLAGTGPVYGGIILLSGLIGGFAASATAGTIYNYIVHGVPPGEPLDAFLRELKGHGP